MCLSTVEKVCHPTGRILQEFNSKGGCSTFGRPINRERPRLSFGGRYQTFEWGEIAHYPTFPKGASTPAFVISGYLIRDANNKPIGQIRANWGPTSKFDKYILRWDREDNEENVFKQHHPDEGDDEQQFDAGSGTSGDGLIVAKGGHGTYSIYVEGCNSSCKQGWSYPVFVNWLDRPLQAVPQPATNPAMFKTGGLVVDGPDLGKITFPELFRLLRSQCSGPLRETGGDHEGELNSEALGWLRAADLIQVFPLPSIPGSPSLADPLKGTECFHDPKYLRDKVSAEILKSVQVSQPGTDSSSLVRTLVAAAIGMSIGALVALVALAIIPGLSALLSPIAVALGLSLSALLGIVSLKSEAGDYDMRLINYIAIYNSYGSKISPAARDHLVDKLLSVRGGADQRREWFHISGLPTPIRETENHIWSTEVSRYLTNNILYDRSPDPAYDNDKNGMTKWVLEGLQQFLTDDFYELNARPYAAYSYQALQTLANYAASNSTNCKQLAVPGAPPQPTRCDVRRAARSVVDYLDARFAASSSGLRRAVPFRRRPEFKSYPMLLTNGGDDMTWRLWAFTGGSDFLHDEHDSRVMESADGYILSAFYGYHPPLVITDLMRSPGVTGLQRFRPKARGMGLAEIYYRTPLYLISAGGVAQDGEGVMATYISEQEDSWAEPTTLMPRKQGADIRDFVRIAGNTDPKRRKNLCVGPQFACGMNPTVPPGIPANCQQKVGNWTFIDFTRDTPECPFNYGYYVAVYREPCTTTACEVAAGDPRPGTFGFFEAAVWRTFDAYVKGVLALNEPEDFTFDKLNVYRSPTGLIVSFMVDTPANQWNIEGYGGAAGMTNPERDLDKWPIAQGNLISSPRRACIFVDNDNLKERLIIDHINAMKPRRSVIPYSLKLRCGCPLIDACLSPRAE